MKIFLFALLALTTVAQYEPPTPTTAPTADCSFPAEPDFYFPDMPLSVAKCPFDTYAEVACITACQVTWTDCKNAAVEAGNATMQATWEAYLADYANCTSSQCECFVAQEYEAALRTQKQLLRNAVQQCNDAYYNCTAACCLPWELPRALPQTIPFKGDTLPLAPPPPRALEACGPPEFPTLNPGAYHPAPECPYEQEMNAGCKFVCDMNDTACRDAAYQATVTYLTNAYYHWMIQYNMCDPNDEDCKCEVVAAWDALVRFNKQWYHSDLDACRGAYDLCCLACCEEIDE